MPAQFPCSKVNLFAFALHLIPRFCFLTRVTALLWLLLWRKNAFYVGVYFARPSFCWTVSEHAAANVISLTRPTEIFKLSKKTAVHADHVVFFDRLFWRITTLRRMFWRRAHDDLTKESY